MIYHVDGDLTRPVPRTIIVREYSDFSNLQSSIPGTEILSRKQ